MLHQITPLEKTADTIFGPAYDPQPLQVQSYRATPPSIRSISEIMSAESFTPEEAALSSTCSGLEAPMIALLTFSWRNTHARASCGMLRSASDATERNPSTAERTSSFMCCCIKRLDSGSAARVPSSGASPERYLPVSTPWASGEKTTWPTPSRSHRGMTPLSILRWIILYCGWLETIRSRFISLEILKASEIW